MSVLLVLTAVAVVFGAVVSTVMSVLPTHSPAVPVAPATVGRELRRIDRLHPALRRRVDPSTATGLALTVALAIVVGGGFGVGVLLVMVREHAGVARFDRWMAEFGAHHATDTSTSVLRALTDLGSTAGVIALAAVVALVELRRIPSRALVPFLALVVVGQSLLSNGVKELVDRARPNIHPLASFTSTSFPSGHSTAAAASYAAFALVLSRERPRHVQTAIVGAAAAVAGAVAASRVLLGVHWLTDALAGLALGWAWFALCAIAFGGRLLRFGAPVEVAERVEAIAEDLDRPEGTERTAQTDEARRAPVGRKRTRRRLDRPDQRVRVRGHPRTGSEA